MKRHRSTNKRKRNLTILVGALIALFLVFFMTRQVLFLTGPLFSLKSKVGSFFERNLAVLKEKKVLQTENLLLREKVSELEVKGAALSHLSEENQRLKTSFLRQDKKEFMLASILERPGYGDYNALIIDAGSGHGVEEGMPVTAFGSVLLGYISDVAPNVSRVKLVSFPQNETNVFIEGHVSAIALGLGGENLEITLPYDVEVDTGNTIATLGTNPLLLGFAERIIRESADPFQKILFRLPVNIQELRHVYLVK